MARRNGNRAWVRLLVVAFAGASTIILACSRAGLRAADGTEKIQPAIDRGRAWLAAHQNPDGGYGPYGSDSRIANTSDVGITAFVLYALARSPKGYKETDGPFVSKAVEFLLARQQSDGAIYDRKDPTLRTYKTSVTLMALNALNRVKHAAAIQKAEEYVRSQQNTPAAGYDKEKHLTFGGVRYGDSPRTSLSVAEFAAEAMYSSGVSGSDEFWKHLVVQVARCRNAKTVDPLLKELGIGTTGDGGYRYGPDDTRGPVETLDDGVRIFSSYGSMTYAALKTLLYARVHRSDPLVQDAVSWLSQNYTVRENPGMATKAKPRGGLEGLFYYYHAMAKALSAYGEPVVKDSKGVEHDWARELSDQIVSIQKEDGSWSNEADRWYEGIPAIGTTYGVVALCECLEFLKAQTEAKKPSEGVAPMPPERGEPRKTELAK